MNLNTTKVTITRPADTVAYTALDVIGDVGGSSIFEFTNMGNKNSDIKITAAELRIDLAAIPAGMTGFNIRLYNAAPTAMADNTVWDLAVADRDKYLGKIVMGTILDEVSTLFIESSALSKQVSLKTTSLFVELQTIGAWTPAASTVIALTLHTES